MSKKTRAEELTELFLQTPEMQECKLAAGSIANKLDPGDTVSMTIEVPKEFVRLTEFLEGKRLAGTAAQPRPTPKVLTQILLNELHDQLHWLSVAPARFEYYRKLWNSFCDEQGAPEEKIADPASGLAKSTEEGPF